MILSLSVVLFVCIDGPLWQHLHDSHFLRIVASYAVIPVLVAMALYRNGNARVLPILVASAVISIIKLVLTAVLLIAIGLARA